MTEPVSGSRPLRHGTRAHAFLGAVLWTLAVVAVLLSGAVAGMTALMPISLDWGETIAAGADPWVSALVAAGEFLAVAAASVIGIVAWHTRRFKPVAIGLVAAAALGTLWLGLRFLADYT